MLRPNMANLSASARTCPTLTTSEGYQAGTFVVGSPRENIDTSSATVGSFCRLWGRSHRWSASCEPSRRPLGGAAARGRGRSSGASSDPARETRAGPHPLREWLVESALSATQRYQAQCLASNGSIAGPTTRHWRLRGDLSSDPSDIRSGPKEAAHGRC